LPEDKAALTSEASVTYNSPEDLDLNLHRRESLKTRNMITNLYKLTIKTGGMELPQDPNRL
jgi:hypothetical protein